MQIHQLLAFMLNPVKKLILRHTRRHLGMGEDTRALIESATEDHITRELFEWLRSIPFYIGLLKGLYLQRQSNDGSIPIRNCYPPSCFQELRYRWTAYYGSL